MYADFSGYTDIAIGIAMLMGFYLPQNFDSPYKSRNPQEFWRRWHMSLSRWLKSYLYIPLGGNRSVLGRPMKDKIAAGNVNSFITMLLGGLWHGASWNFVIWGALHGVYQIVGNLTRTARDGLIERLGHTPEDRSVIAVRRTLTFFLVLFAWLIFRANSISDAMLLIGKVFSDFGGIGDTLSHMGLGLSEILTVFFALISLFFMDRLVDYSENDSADALTSHGALVYYVYIIALVWIFLLSQGIESSFIYFRF